MAFVSFSAVFVIWDGKGMDVISLLLVLFPFGVGSNGFFVD
jgi:hypothetical protein